MGTKVPSIHIQIPHILQAFIIISDHWAIKSIAVSLTHNVRHVFYYVNTCIRSVWPHITRNTPEGVTMGSSMLYVPLCVSYISPHYLFSCTADTALQCTILFNDKTLKIVKIVMSKNCKWCNTFTLADRVTTSHPEVNLSDVLLENIWSGPTVPKGSVYLMALGHGKHN